MTIAIVFLLITVAALIWVAISARGHASGISQLSDLPGRTQPVDVAAFRNLVDPSETEFLRKRLPAGQFRKTQRQRLRAAVEYVDCVSGNAAVLLRLGEAARLNEDPQVAAAGAELVNTALRVRVYAVMARTKLYAGMLLPAVPLSAGPITDSYENLTGMVGRLGRLQSVRQPVRVSALL
jgi:hypothetical protein